MKQRHFGNFTFFLFLFMVLAGWIGECFPSSAYAGTSVYRASIGPRPQDETAAAADIAPPATVRKSAPTKAKSAPVKSSAKSAKKSSGKPAASAKSSTKSSAKTASKAATKTSSKTTAKNSSKKAAPKTASKNKFAAKVAKAPTTVTAQTLDMAKAEPAPAPAGSYGVTGPKTFSSSGQPATARDLYLNVKSAILINMTTGKVYYEHNADKTIPPASITKLLTLYLVREAMSRGSLAAGTPIPVSDKAVSTGGSRMRLKRGEKVPLSELIKGISVVSANNACVAVAEYLGQGDPSRFVSQMNAKARSIGMNNSLFKNPNGLPAPGQLSTARDIARLSISYLRAFPESLSVHSMTTHTFHGATHRNANSLLRTYKGADGLKTGFVCASGYNITATAKRGGTRLVAVVLGAQNSVIRQRETAKLLDFGFRRAALEDGMGSSASAAGKKPDA